jgi:hypothetical protein
MQFEDAFVSSCKHVHVDSTRSPVRLWVESSLVLYRWLVVVLQQNLMRANGRVDPLQVLDRVPNRAFVNFQLLQKFGSLLGIKPAFTITGQELFGPRYSYLRFAGRGLSSGVGSVWEAARSV